MSDHPAKNIWAAISALAAVATIVLTIVMWRHGQNDPASGESESASADQVGESSPTSADTEAAQGSGAWEETDSYTISLPTTFQGHDCRDLHIDLDEQGESELLDGDSEPAEGADLIWYSCGGSQPGHFYSVPEASGLTPSGESLEPDVCNSATSGDSYLSLSVDPGDPPTELGCLITTSGALAGVSPTGLDRVGEGVVADLQVILWQRAG
ncbi:hypothetical protein [Glycomyces algeriensis]|uniref:Uncharacterized protein n=1 Tax=Glycomyces algeriensis TaxID=256037 RepID=A0A9W6G8J3_9ACTN|nr:hypothetical protein [Glycomyces algeriensis]MDA1365189.1 hypothetical protein [Glycomyces algeriensis]MDR7349747.1 hypothetical protein [Glycomyces algeriensis]GLI42456.1 hypothetical protein GALLR39Z86_23060 [Glycomyces algeriensis]